MALPKIEHPVIEIEVPSTGEKKSFRPFLVKEEKILLIAEQVKSRKETLKSVKQVINNCSLDDIDTDALLLVDIEYIFLQLRATSVNNIIDLNFTDNEDQKDYAFKVDINDIKVVKPKKKVSNKIAISDKVGIIIRHANGLMVDKMPEYKNDINLFLFYIKNCIVEIYDEETVYDAKEIDDKELDEFVDNIPSKCLDKIRAYLATTPTMQYTIEYKNSLGNDRKIVLSNLDDFFTLG